MAEKAGDSLQKGGKISQELAFESRNAERRTRTADLDVMNVPL
jgi:hypothetical protein